MRLFIQVMMAELRWNCARIDAGIAQSISDAVAHRAPRFIQYAARVRANSAWLDEYSYCLAASMLDSQYQARYPLR